MASTGNANCLYVAVMFLVVRPLLTLLVGLGLREFSMAPTAIPLAKQVLRGLHSDRAAHVAARALRARTAAEIEKLLARFLAPQETVRND